MKLRYAGTCRLCGKQLAAKVEAIYERPTKTVRCLDCEPSDSEEPRTHFSAPLPPVDVGIPGASARAEFERRRAKDEARVRGRFPKIGRFLLAVTEDRQSTKSWDSGARGEERIGHKLNELASDTIGVLHDRRVPRSRANIDHLAITSAGVFVIDPKRYVGQRPALRVEGGLLRPRVEKLMVSGRDRTNLVEGVLKQVALVRVIVGDEMPVAGILCFVEGDWPLIGGPFSTRGVEVTYPRKLYRRLAMEGRYADRVGDMHRTLADALPAYS